MNDLILIGLLVIVVWLVRRDNAGRNGISAPLWLPTAWVAILASRPVSMWLGGGTATDTIEGSPIDRLIFFGLLSASAVVLSRRQIAWGHFVSRNWPILLFYGYLLVSVAWANSPLSSLKRWTKEIGNILMVLVILTEADPLQAFRAVFVRCAFFLIPVSVVLLRYFPSVGRFYNGYSGELQVTGVTTQKNSLGAMILVCLLVYFWDWLERSRPGRARRGWLERLTDVILFATGAWLLWISDSKTSMTCLTIGTAIIATVRLPVLQRRISAIGIYGLIAAIGFVTANWAFDISRHVVSDLGRDMTFTGRTEVWRELLNVHTDPVFGTGYMSFWDDIQYRSLLPDWVAYSAHNGYLEIYLSGGLIGVGFLGVMLLGVGLRINRALTTGTHYSVVRLAIYVIALLANISESNFAWMTPIGVLFLVAGIGAVERIDPAIYLLPATPLREGRFTASDAGRAAAI